MASPCGPLPGPPFGYLCEDELGDPVLDDLVTVGGTPAVQGPLRFCGTNERVCVDDQVSSCLSDTDGNPTTYGPAPSAPSPSDVTGRSPRFSRLRINREGLTVFPYSTAKKPDQLIDIVIDGGEGPDIPVPWDGGTGRFTFPASEVFPTLPTAGCGLTLNEDNEFDVDDTYHIETDDAQVLGNTDVLSFTGSMVQRCNVHPVIENTTCRNQHVFSSTFPGFGVEPENPGDQCQIQYGVYNVTQAAVLQISQSPIFTAGWQHKETYLYPATGASTIAPAADFGDELCLFIVVLASSDPVVWVDADFSCSLWYGS
jgi:hypothetical protein